MPTFEFNNQLMPQSLVDIENIGDFAIEASNDQGEFWYLVVRTLLGTVTLASCGPLVPDVELLPSGYSCVLNRMEYKEDRLEKTINVWLNDRSKLLTQAKILPIEEAIDQFRDLGDYLRRFGTDIF